MLHRLVGRQPSKNTLSDYLINAKILIMVSLYQHGNSYVHDIIVLYSRVRFR